MEKNGVCFMVTAFLVVKVFKILFHANQRTCDVTRLTRKRCKITKYGIPVQSPQG